MHHAVVTKKFGKYLPGNHIKDLAEVEAIYNSPRRHCIVKVYPESDDPKEIEDGKTYIEDESEKTQPSVETPQQPDAGNHE